MEEFFTFEFPMPQTCILDNTFCLSAAPWSVTIIQQSYEHPQHALHWSVHCGDDPQTYRLQTQGMACILLTTMYNFFNGILL